VTAGLSLLVTYPLSLAHFRLCADSGNDEFDDLGDCFAIIARQGGILALYAGVWTAVARTQLWGFAYLNLYSLAEHPALRKALSSASPIYKLAFSQAVAIAASVVAYPLATVQARLVLQAGGYEERYSGAFHCLSTLVREEGPAALFAGVRTAVAISASSLLLVAYDVAAQHLASGKR
jgi:hypothetical protein